MTHTASSVKSIELGKGFIVKYLREVMASKGIDPEPMLFIWEQDRLHARWNLTVYFGWSKHTIRFTQRDVVGWPWSRGVLAGMYDRGIRSLIEKVRAA